MTDRMIAIFSVIVAILGILVAVLTPIVEEYILQPYRFKKSGGRSIAGTYFSVWHTNACSNCPPVTWEKGVITQRGKKIRYRSQNNDLGYDYELIGVIQDDVIVGHWVSRKKGEKVKGGAILYYTPRGNIVGFWLGDCKVNILSWGYWGISNSKATLEKLVTNMQNKVKFESVNILNLVE